MGARTPFEIIECVNSLEHGFNTTPCRCIARLTINLRKRLDLLQPLIQSKLTAPMMRGVLRRIQNLIEGLTRLRKYATKTLRDPADREEFGILLARCETKVRKTERKLEKRLHNLMARAL